MASSSPKTPTAADLMTATPRTCSTYSTVLEAVLIFRDADCGVVPILENGHAIGLLTDRDVALALTEHGENLLRLPVSEIMTRGTATVELTATVEEIADRFSDKAVRRLLVVDGADQLQGIIAWADIAPHLTPEQLGKVVNDVVGPS